MYFLYLCIGFHLKFRKIIRDGKFFEYGWNPESTARNRVVRADKHTDSYTHTITHTHTYKTRADMYNHSHTHRHSPTPLSPRNKIFSERKY